MGDTLNLGGTEGQFAEIATRLDRSHWDLHVACLRAQGPLRPKLEAAGIQPWSCGPGSFKSPRVLLAVLEVARYLKTHHIRLVHTFDFYSNLLGVLAARFARTPATIASQRDLGNLRPPYQRRLHALALRLATHIVVNSRAVAEQVRRSIPSRTASITVVTNGVDLLRFRPRPQPETGAHVLVGTVANLRPEKGLRHLVEAAALVRERVPQARFAIWGDGPERPALESLIQRRALGKVLELRGSTTEPERALRECDIFVLPSLSEACSNVLMEAMATGLPVIATNVGGSPDLVDHGRAGLLVPPGDEQALADAVVRLLGAPAIAGELARQGRERARLEFAMTRMLARMDSLYLQVLGGRPVSTVRAGAAEGA
jgi:glycosyltransferase involved in cell wall biosynthesis